jgi:phosphohistidine phosphatase
LNFVWLANGFKMLQLHLLRHAKTEVNSPTGADFDRELMIKGIVQSNMMGLYFELNELAPQHILSSSSVRTSQTLDLVRHSLPNATVQLETSLYLADRETLLNEIWKQKKGQQLLLIGHNEGISNLASYLTGDRINLKTCGYLRINFPFDQWNELSHGTGTIDLMYRPAVYFP